MADIELTHSAKGSTWQKKNASYISRVKKNGKWVYTYNRQSKTPGNDQIQAEMDKAKYGYYRQGGKFTMPSSYPKPTKQQSDKSYSSAESLKRKQVSAQRNVQKDTRYKINAKTAYIKNKASRNINKGKKKVSELLERLKNNASTSVTKVKKAANATVSKAKKKAEQKAVNFVTKQINKNSTKAEVVKLASKMGYSSSDVAEAYDFVKDQLNNYESPSAQAKKQRRKKMEAESLKKRMKAVKRR